MCHKFWLYRKVRNKNCKPAREGANCADSDVWSQVRVDRAKSSQWQQQLWSRNKNRPWTKCSQKRVVCYRPSVQQTLKFRFWRRLPFLCSRSASGLPLLTSCLPLSSSPPTLAFLPGLPAARPLSSLPLPQRKHMVLLTRAVPLSPSAAGELHGNGGDYSGPPQSTL